MNSNFVTGGRFVSGMKMAMLVAGRTNDEISAFLEEHEELLVHMEMVDIEHEQQYPVILQDNDKYSVICCPICQFPFSHIITGTIPTLIDAQDVGGGGDKQIVIEFEGECEHYWSLVLEEHEGTTDIYCKEIGIR